MLDRFVYGDIRRISPEAPVPIVRKHRMSEMLGGAGNVANNLAALGAQAILVGLIGEDESGQLIRSHASALPGAEAVLVASGRRPTTCKTRLIAAHQQVLRIDEESQSALSDDESEQLFAAASPWIERSAAIILSDYQKGVLTRSLIERVMQAARAARVPVFVDPKSTDFSHYRGATCIKPNLKELALASGEELRDEADIVRAARRLLDIAGAEAVLVTRSEQGMSLVTADDVHTVPARTREVYDVSGAGDTAIAALALSYAMGHSLIQSTAFANAAAGVVVSKLGTATATMAEVTRELALADGQAAAAPVVRLRSLPEARELVARWRRQGQNVGFTNGCFDILHVGHIASLAHARASCDQLIVALNSDASVQQLKGPARPINSLEARARVIASLRDVDCVVGFDELTPLNIIRDLSPNTLIKGSDYDGKEVVGADYVQSMGGKVVLTPFVDGYSTTGLVAMLEAMEAGS